MINTVKRIRHVATTTLPVRFKLYKLIRGKCRELPDNTIIVNQEYGYALRIIQRITDSGFFRSRQSIKPDISVYRFVYPIQCLPFWSSPVHLVNYHT